MKRLLLTMSKVLVAIVCSLSLASCAGDRATAPSPLVAGSRTDATDLRKSLERQIAGIEFLLSTGFDESVLSGVDASVIDSRRQAAIRDLKVLRDSVSSLRETGALKNGTELELPQAPPCAINLRLDGCFLNWWTDISIRGTGTTYASATLPLSHTSATYLAYDNGGFGIPKTTNGPLLLWFWYGDFEFTAPDCSSDNHTVQARTVHNVSIGLMDVGSVQGSQESQDLAACQFIKVTLSRTSIFRNDLSYITTGPVPSACVTTFTSSNPSVVTIEDFHGRVAALSGYQTGTAIISARCGDARGSVSISVVGGDEPIPDSYTPAGVGGSSECALEDTYLWFRWDYSLQEYRFMGEVCLPTRLVTSLRARRQLKESPQANSSRSATATPAKDAHAILVSSPDLPEGEVRVLRRRQVAQGNVVLVGAGASGQALALALGSIGAVRLRDGEAVSHEIEFVPRGRYAKAEDAQVRLAQAWISELRRSREIAVPGIGKRRALVVAIGPAPKSR